jgi:cohesin complex subunit SA-1/2
MSLMLIYFMWKCRDCAVHIEEGSSMPDDELTALVERRDTCITALMRIMESRKGADDVRLEAANLLLDIYNMFRSLKAKQGKAARTPKKTQGRASTSASDDWEALSQSIDTHTAKTLTHILTATETALAKLANKRLEEPDVDDDPIDPDDEPESDEEDADERTQSEKQLRTLLAEERLCHFGARIVQAVQVGSLDSANDDSMRRRLERNKGKLTPTWREVVGHLDAVRHAKRGAKKTKPAKEAKSSKSEAIVVEDESDEEMEVQGDEIEDEDMDDVEAEGVNGEEEEEEEEEHEQGNGEKDADEESILGD